MIKNINRSFIKYPKIKGIINIVVLILLKILFTEVVYAEEFTIQEEPETINYAEIIIEIMLDIGAILLFTGTMGLSPNGPGILTITAIVEIWEIVDEFSGAIEDDDEDSEASFCDMI